MKNPVLLSDDLNFQRNLTSIQRTRIHSKYRFNGSTRYAADLVYQAMRKIYLLLVILILFGAKLQAHAPATVAGKNSAAPLDLVGPVVSYTLLGQSGCTTIRTFTATITDVDGVNTTPGTRPRVYYQRVGDGNVLLGNTSATLGWKYTESTGNVGSTFTFNIDYSLLNGGVVSGQTIQYFVIAQDLAATPNIGVGSATTFNTAPTSVALTAANFGVGGAINAYSIVNALPTNITVGSFGDFSTLSTAGGVFSAINNVGLSGNTTVELIDPLITENNAIQLGQIQNTGCTAGPVTLLIKPAAGISTTLTGNVGTKPIITILSSNVTVDGSNNGTSSRNLTLVNTNATGSNVIMIGSSGLQPTSNSTLKNTICINGSNSTSAGAVVVCDVATGSVGYFNNITIQNNSIQKSYIGILCTAVAGPGNGTNVIVSGNDLNSTAPNQVGLLGIYTEGLDGASISNNNVGNFEPTITGPRYGIYLNSNTINSTVSNNIISGINYSGTGSAATYGINLAPAIVNSGNVISGNTISNITSGSNGTASQQIVCGINVTGASGGISIQKNKISNIKHSNVAGFAAYGIGLSSSSTTSNITVANNFIFDVAGYGLATVIRNGVGIFMGAGGGYKIYHNSVHMNTNQTNPVAGVSAALMVSGVTTASSVDIRDNILVNSQTLNVPVAARYSIYSANANTIFSNIDYNDYYTATGTNLGFLGGQRAALTDIQTGFGSNLNSLNVQPNFVSSTDLHLTTANCGIDNKGIAVGVTTDIDGAARDLGTPDMGADEFTATLSGALAGIVSAAVCDNKNVSVSGTNFVTNACDLIATVLPSGGSPLSGLVNACVTRDASQQYFNGEPYVQRHYDIEPATNAATATATVTLYFSDVEFQNYNSLNPVWPPLPTVIGGANSDPNIANVRITQFHGTPTGGLPTTTPGNYTGARLLIIPTSVFWNGTYWQVTLPVSGFSGFYLHTTLTNLPLPIVINYLTGRRQGSDHLLNWKITCTSTPRATMELQRSADGRNYSGIFNITADALRCQQPFDFTDSNPLAGMNYYRLKITDADGHVTYSTTVALLNAIKGFDIISVAPNPVVSNDFKLNITSAQAGKMEIIIFDMQGRMVNRQSLTVIAGYNSLPVNAANLSPGTYIIKATNTVDETRVTRFVKQ